jgi:cytochrome oxidase Cu insertion factor (SCO1/SenC/PrrC family)
MRRHTLSLQRQLLVGIIGLGLLLGAGFAAALEVGDKAPDFELPSTTGEKISLSQFKGKKNVLLQFYTLEFNPT